MFSRQREPKDGTRKGKQYKLKTSLVKKNRLHRGDWNPYGKLLFPAKLSLLSFEVDLLKNFTLRSKKES